MSTRDIQLVLLMWGLLAGARATRHVCNPVNNMACYSANQLQVCDQNNLPTREIYSCPAGQVCVSGANGVLCQASGGDSSSDNQVCNKCDASGSFACTGPSSFALCLGTDTPQNWLGSCAAGFVCSTRNARICAPATEVEPSCTAVNDSTTTTTTTAATTTTTPETTTTTTAETTTTTTTTPITTTTTTTTTAATPSTSNANDYCAAVQAAGNYPVGDYAETTCRQYIKCFLLGGSWWGQKYKCPGSTYFSPSTRECVTTMPGNCYTPLSTTTTTTAAPTTSNPNAYCAALQAQGTYPVGTDAKSSCRQYIYCFQLNGSWWGKKYTCPGSTYYSSASGTCVTDLPATCT